MKEKETRKKKKTSWGEKKRNTGKLIKRQGKVKYEEEKNLPGKGKGEREKKAWEERIRGKSVKEEQEQTLRGGEGGRLQ